MSINHDIMRRAAFVERAVRRSEDRYHDRRDNIRDLFERFFAALDRDGLTDATLTELFYAGRALKFFIRETNGTDPWSQWMYQLVRDIVEAKFPLADARSHYERLKFKVPTNPGG
jgi:hypothetical protein